MNNAPAEQLLLFALLIGLAAAYYYRRTWRPDTSAHGTGRWSEKKDLKRAGMLSGPGLILGRTLKKGRLIRMRRFQNLAVIAPTGAGKGVSFLIVWLLSWLRGSCVVLDPKGELYRATAAKRRARGQKVYRLDPFGVCGPGADCFNPLDLIGGGPECVDDARAFAEAMVVRPPDGDRDPHWSDQAANLITAWLSFILVRLAPAERTLSSLRALVTDPSVYEATAKVMQEMGGVFARLGGIMLSLVDKEKAGVVSTVNRHTTFLDSMAVMASTGSSSFDVRELLKGNVTLYLILPPHQLEAQSRWLRLVIASLIRLIGREGMAKGKECLMLLDEAGQLGHMQPIEQGLTLLRSYGLKMAFFFQSLGQLKEVFKDKESVLLDNTEQIYFGVNSLETAERISKMLGSYTHVTESYTENDSRSHQTEAFGSANQGVQVSTSRGVTVAVHAREILKPEEVLQLHEDVVIAFLKGVPPIAARRLKYFSDPLFKRRRARLWWALLAAAALALAILTMT